MSIQMEFSEQELQLLFDATEIMDPDCEESHDQVDDLAARLSGSLGMPAPHEFSFSENEVVLLISAVEVVDPDSSRAHEMRRELEDRLREAYHAIHDGPDLF